jgi:hypothetical protein
MCDVCITIVTITIVINSNLLIQIIIVIIEPINYFLKTLKNN